MSESDRQVLSVTLDLHGEPCLRAGNAPEAVPIRTLVTREPGNPGPYAIGSHGVMVEVTRGKAVLLDGGPKIYKVFIPGGFVYSSNPGDQASFWDAEPQMRANCVTFQIPANAPPVGQDIRGVVLVFDRPPTKPKRREVEPGWCFLAWTRHTGDEVHAVVYGDGIVDRERIAGFTDRDMTTGGLFHSLSHSVSLQVKHSSSGDTNNHSNVQTVTPGEGTTLWDKNPHTCPDARPCKAIEVRSRVFVRPTDGLPPIHHWLVPIYEDAPVAAAPAS